MYDRATEPPPTDLPDTTEGAPAWPPWYGIAGFALVLAAAALVATLLAGIASALGAELDGPTPKLTLVATLLQDVLLVAVAALLAARVARPRAWHFGLRRIPLRRAATATGLAAASFYAFALVYALLFEPQGEQTVVEDLGVDRGTLNLVAAAVLVVGLAPIAEELFFRAFFYGSLRRRFAPLPAALIAGALFGAIHYTDPDTLSLLPVLAVLGVTFCLLYERTGSIYPPIALHALNNALAFGAAAGSDLAWAVAGAVGAALIVACAAAARGGPHGPAPLPARDNRAGLAPG